MHLFPTNRLARRATKTLKEMKVELTPELAELINSEFSTYTDTFVQRDNLRYLVGRFHQRQVARFFGNPLFRF